jgi:hypothetical protein
MHGRPADPDWPPLTDDETAEILPGGAARDGPATAAAGGPAAADRARVCWHSPRRVMACPPVVPQCRPDDGRSGVETVLPHPARVWPVLGVLPGSCCRSATSLLQDEYWQVSVQKYLRYTGAE